MLALGLQLTMILLARGWVRPDLGPLIIRSFGPMGQRIIVSQLYDQFEINQVTQTQGNCVLFSTTREDYEDRRGEDAYIIGG